MNDVPLPSALPKRKTVRNNQAGRARITAVLLASPFDIARDPATGEIVLSDASWERVRFWVMDQIDARVTKRHFDAIAASLPL